MSFSLENPACIRGFLPRFQVSTETKQTTQKAKGDVAQNFSFIKEHTRLRCIVHSHT
jgi:hypothetical protein